MAENPIATNNLSVDRDSLRTAAKRVLYRQELWDFFAKELKLGTKGVGLPPQPFVPNPVQVPILKAAQNQLKRTGKIRQIIFKCLAPQTRVLTADLRWVEIASVKKGDHLIGVDEHAPSGRGRQRAMRTSIVEAVWRVNEPAFKLTLDNGIELIATGEHRFLFRQRGGDYCQWRFVNQVKPGDYIRHICDPWSESGIEDGWFGGLLDGEGCLKAGSTRSGVEISLFQVPGPVLDRARNYLRDRDYAFYEGIDQRNPGNASKLGNQPVHRLCLSRTADILRLMGQTRPTRWQELRFWEDKCLPGKRIGNAWRKIVSVEPLKTQEMVDIQTSSRTFIAEGIVSHNCRQPGISTYSSGIIWNRTSLFSGVYSFIIAQDKTTVGNVFNMHSTFYNNMSPEIRPPLTYFVKGSEIVLGNIDSKVDSDVAIGSKLLVGEAKNLHVGTGQTIHCLHMTEVCRYPSSDSIKDSLIPACSDFPGTVRIYESTAHFGGGASWFQDQCQRAMHGGDTDLEYFFVEWWRLPDYSRPLDKGEKLKLDSDEKFLVKRNGLSLENIKWRRWKIADLEGDVDSFRLNYPMNYEEAWITKESSTFPREQLMEMREACRPPFKKFKILPQRGHDGHFTWNMYEDPEGEFWVWNMPVRGKTYDIGGDVAEGMVDGDWSVAEVIERGTNEQCAEYRDKVLPDDFGDILAFIGRFYNTAQVAPEVNAGGLSTIKRLREIYPNIYLWRKDDLIVPKFTGLMGWKTQYDSKQILVALTRGRIFRRETIIHSEVLWNELKFFARDFTPTGMITYHAAVGHDDCVLAYMIALKASDDENLNKYRSIEVKDANPVAMIDKALYDHEGLFPEGIKDDISPWN